MERHEIPIKTRIFIKKQELDEKLKNIKKRKRKPEEIKSKRKVGSSGQSAKSEFLTLIKHRLKLREFCDKSQHVYRYIHKLDLDYSPIDFQYTPVEASVCCDCRDVQSPPVDKCIKCFSTFLYKTEMIIPKIFGDSRIRRCDCCGHTERAGYKHNVRKLLPKEQQL